MAAQPDPAAVAAAAVAASPEPLVERELFGGAMKISLPERFADVSQLRQIPDTQEVFACTAGTDQSLIVDLLELEEAAVDEQAAVHHFNMLANLNDAAESALEGECTSEPLPPPHQGTKSFCVGRQQVAKYHEGVEQANDVRVFVAVYRLRSHNTDVVITLNGATQVNPESSSKAAVDEQAQAVANDAAIAGSLFNAIIATFEMVDYSLFG